MTGAHTKRAKALTARTAVRSPLAEHLSSPLLDVDLNAEIEDLRGQEPLARTGRNAKTLVKHVDLRIVLIVMKAGARMEEHKAAGRFSLQTLDGHVSMHLPDQTVELPAGHMLALDRCLPHGVEARTDSAFLLSLSWPAESEIEECKARAKTRGSHVHSKK